MFRNIKYGIQNLIKWFPTVWKDRDCDHVFLMEVLHFKLSNMSKLHRKYGIAVNSDKYADDLQLAAKLAQRIAEDDYTEEAFGNKLYLLEKNKMEFVDVGDGRSKIEFTGLTDDEREELMRLYGKEEELLKKDIEKLFDLMKRELRNWWD